MEFNPLKETLQSGKIFYVKNNALHTSSAKHFFRRFFLRKQYDQQKVIPLFQQCYKNAPHKTLNELEHFKTNYETVIHPNHREGCCNFLVKIFLWILYGKGKRETSKTDLHFQNKVQSDYAKKEAQIKKFLEENKYQQGIQDLEFFCRFFAFTEQHYFARLMDSEIQAASKNLHTFIESSLVNLEGFSESELKELLKHLENLQATLEQFQTQEKRPNLDEALADINKSIVNVKIQLESLNFTSEFQELLNEDKDATIFDSVTACGELNILYAKDFIDKLNSYLPKDKHIKAIDTNNIAYFQQILDEASLLYLKNYVKNKIFTYSDFEAYLKKNALPIRHNIVTIR